MCRRTLVAIDGRRNVALLPAHSDLVAVTPARGPRIPETPMRSPPSPALDRQRSLVSALRDRLSSCGVPLRLLETHISYVLLTGVYAYKIKKAITLDFLDFGTLEARRRLCEEEVRLNQRLAPALYIDVVRITGTPSTPAIGGTGEVLEYAVRMREFASDALLGDVLARDELRPAHVDALAAQIADFHAAAPAALPDSEYGTPRRVIDHALANFEEVAASAPETWDRAALQALRRWTRRQASMIRNTLERRRLAGSIRECHGDLHLGNIALIGGDVTPFDCIEFNPSMRWIDTMSEIAFTVMDLERRGAARLAYRFLAAYLERSGDYGGVAVLRFYLVYRAMVRAKVACLRASQASADEREALRLEFAEYVSIAWSYATGAFPAVVLMHGFSGSGKTTISQLLLERTGALRIRTDVERKRLAGLTAGAHSNSAIDGGIYTQDATRGVYDHVRACAASVIGGGFPALVDGAFLHRWQRDLFRELAAERAVPFVIVDCVASPATLEARVGARSRAGTDASEANVAVLRRQLQTSDALGIDELGFVLECDAEAPFEHGCSSAALRRIEESVRAAIRSPPAPSRRSKPA
jgi:aminoglycoside phosphotransferase family enzyme/predicted kinase